MKPTPNEEQLAYEESLRREQAVPAPTAGTQTDYASAPIIVVQKPSMDWGPIAIAVAAAVALFIFWRGKR